MTQLQSGKHASIVIAEDESLIRIDLAEMLTELGYDVLATAADGEAAVELVAKLAPDIALLDIKMPKMDGLTAAERIGEVGGTAVVMLTAFSQGELIDRARAAGAMAFLVKPVTASDLTPTLELARARFAEKVALESEVEDLNQRLVARKAVDRAKAILQQRFGMGEADAFRWLQKAAMDRRMSMQAVAEVVIAESPSRP
ncbi:MAG: response regulator [Candidatus Nanopelagicales bacterium]